jgi:hypothetical protein
MFYEFMDSNNFIAILAITMGCVTGMVGIIAGTVSTVLRTRSKEQTKREMAAYVAEGTIDPDKAIEMLKAGMPKWELPGMKA